MTYDPNFPRLTPYGERYDPLQHQLPFDESGSGWSSVIAVASVIFIAGALIIFTPSSTDRTTTASNDAPAATHSVPPVAPRAMLDTGAPTPQPMQ
jgi:hypothetical protein